MCIFNSERCSIVSVTRKIAVSENNVPQFQDTMVRGKVCIHLFRVPVLQRLDRKCLIFIRGVTGQLVRHLLILGFELLGQGHCLSLCGGLSQQFCLHLTNRESPKSDFSLLCRGVAVSVRPAAVIKLFGESCRISRSVILF